MAGSGTGAPGQKDALVKGQLMPIGTTSRPGRGAKLEDDELRDWLRVLMVMLVLQREPVIGTVHSE